MVHELVDLGARPHVDAPGRFVEDQNIHVPKQPLAHHHLLLVAAREIFHHLLDARRLDAQCAHVFIGVPLTVPAPDEAVVAHLVVGGEHGVAQ